MNVCAVVVARGMSGSVDVLTAVGGTPMITRSVQVVLAGLAELSTTDTSDRVIVVAPSTDHAAIGRACAGLPVDVRERLPLHAGPPRAQPVRAHVGERATPGPGDGSDSIFLLHDAARPLTPPALVTAVLEAAATAIGSGGFDAVVPLLPLTDTVKLVDADDLITATPDRTGLRVLQTPQAVRADLADLVGIADLTDPERDPFDVVLDLAAHGSVHAVDGDPMAFPVHTPWDLELAELLAAGR